MPTSNKIHTLLPLDRLEPEDWDKWIHFFEKYKSEPCFSPVKEYLDKTLTKDCFSGLNELQIQAVKRTINERKANICGIVIIPDKRIISNFNLVDLKVYFPKMHSNIIKVYDIVDVEEIVIFQLTSDLLLHRDFSPYKTTVRCVMSKDQNEHGFNFFNENLSPIDNIVLDKTNWFAFNDSLCFHSYEPKNYFEYIVAVKGRLKDNLL